MAEKRYHNETITALQTQYQKIQNRIDAMYLDKLDQKIAPAFFEQKSTEWRGEQTEIRRKIEKHEYANRSYMDQGIQFLELAQKAVTLYEKQEMMEKRRLLNFVFSNSTWKDGTLIPNYRQSFSMLAVANASYQKQFLNFGSSGRTRTYNPPVNSCAAQVISESGVSGS